MNTGDNFNQGQLVMTKNNGLWGKIESEYRGTCTINLFSDSDCPVTAQTQDVTNFADTFTAICKEFGVTKRIHILRFQEAYRRLFMFNRDKAIQDAWVALNTPAQMRDNPLFAIIGTSTVRCWSWFKLSPMGVKVMEAIIHQIPFPSNPDDISKVNEILYGV